MAKKLLKKSKNLRKIILLVVAIVGSIAIFYMLVKGNNVAVLDPQGIIASKEKSLILITTILGLLVVVPVFILLFTVAWKYRATNTRAVYTPDADGSRLLETLWWGIPIIIIGILGIITWVSTHELDPYKSLSSSEKPVTIQVVSLQWRWLFIYPEQGFATINYMPIPEKTPINFKITSDAPMNSFWIPNLGGQVYAMSGMSTQLHLMADTTGLYPGSSANISGEGFAGMKFTAESMSRSDFKAYAVMAAQSSDSLAQPLYEQLALPSKDNDKKTYTLMDKDLYNKIIMKYMTPPSDSSDNNAVMHMVGM